MAGHRLSNEDREAVFTAFAKTRTTKATARLTGLSPRTVQRLVFDGDPSRGWEPLVERLEEYDEALRREGQQEMTQAATFVRRAFLKALTKVPEMLNVTVKEGETSPDGTRTVSAKGFREAVGVLRDLTELGQTLQAEQPPSGSVSFHRQPPIGVDPRAAHDAAVMAREEAQAFMRRNAGVIREVAGTPRESTLVDGLMREAAKRGLIDGEESPDDEEDEE